MIPENFFDITAPLYKGQRFIHPNCCEGKDKALKITRFPNGWKYICHRCGEKGVRSLNKLSPEEYLEWKRSAKNAIRESCTVEKVELPTGYTTNIPAAGLAWLYKYDLTDREIHNFKIGYSPVINRIILPVYDQAGELLYWQGRNLGVVNRNFPKYINVKSQGRTDIYFDCTRGNSDVVVLVEDIISTIRVSRCEESIGLLYAYIPDKLILKLCKSYKKIILWLDPDKRSRMTERVSRYRSFGIDVVSVRSSRDPKDYSDHEISNKLCEV